MTKKPKKKANKGRQRLEDCNNLKNRPKNAPKVQDRLGRNEIINYKEKGVKYMTVWKKYSTCLIKLINGAVTNLQSTL